MNRYLQLTLFVCGITAALTDCPPGTTVGPCDCFVDNEQRLSLQCKNVQDGSEIADVIVQIQVTEIDTIDITNSRNLTSMPTNTFGETAVYHIRFYNTAILGLSADVFSGPTSSTLQSLYVKHTDSYTNIDANMVSSLTGLEELYLSWTGVSSLSGSIGTSQSLQYVDLSHNSISYVSDDFFAEAPALTIVLMAFNELTSFANQSLTFQATQGDLYIDLGYNSLDVGLQGATFTQAVPRELILSGNGISRLEETTYAPLLDMMVAQYNNSYILLDNNPLECGCDVAWVPLSPYRDMLQSAQCSNGQLLNNLGPSDFTDC